MKDQIVLRCLKILIWKFQKEKSRLLLEQAVAENNIYKIIIRLLQAGTGRNKVGDLSLVHVNGSFGVRSVVL